MAITNKTIVFGTTGQVGSDYSTYGEVSGFNAGELIYADQVTRALRSSTLITHSIIDILTGEVISTSPTGDIGVLEQVQDVNERVKYLLDDYITKRPVNNLVSSSSQLYNLLYVGGINTTNKLANGTSGQILLAASNGMPTWSDQSGLTVNNVSAISISGTNTATIGITIGTASNSFTVNNVANATRSTTCATADDSNKINNKTFNMTSDGTTLTITYN